MGDCERDIKILDKAFYNDQIRSELCEVICERTNSHLKELQEHYAKKQKDNRRGPKNQPLALKEYLEKKIKAATTGSSGLDIRRFVERVMTDPYTRPDGPTARDTGKSVNQEQAGDHAEDLKELAEEGAPLFLRIFLPGQGGNMMFSQVKATVEAFGEEELLDELEECFSGIWGELCLRYIKFALK